ncbi:peptidase C15, pyroglutamyl peptidase I-like protein [Daedalea quercina L-15889]|uniref:Peptidase C15, pyroglutamyl peptidase I-like protein n=1 Tax=Daedalea quercina L-15889 TaxID=1314783 RepID=A0A165SIH8_9APHY|nr:peptidase C15, pyroglutamyl peptidase I-like protein [Daedalea quercina L-15889]
MPVPAQTTYDVDPDALRVLVTGYGPFRSFKINPSWLAVKPLHNITIRTAEDRPVHVTSLEIPTVYESVLTLTSSIHSRPPIVPTPKDPAMATAKPPTDGYDFILHVGVMSKSGNPIRLEQRGRKYGYDKDDAEGNMCEVVKEAEGADGKPLRGFGKVYEGFPDELFTPIDCSKLGEHLKAGGLKQVTLSVDAGLYLCEFINYCSLAEAKRTAATAKKATPVLFIHVPPVGEPLTTEEVTDALKIVISWGT